MMMCSDAWHKQIYKYLLYTLNPVESNHRNGPAGHKNYQKFSYYYEHTRNEFLYLTDCYAICQF